jgi:uncharacterized protein (DUF1697 family)
VGRYVALLRGINVGRNKKIAMADLRELLTGLGYTDVRTHLQSGNALFTATGSPARLSKQIEVAIQDELGMDVRCLIRSAKEIRAVIDANPLADVATNGSRFLALFLSTAPDPKLLKQHNPVDLAPDDIRIGDRVIYQWCPDGILAAPPISGFVEKHLKVVASARNWNTVTRLGELLAE